MLSAGRSLGWPSSWCPVYAHPPISRMPETGQGCRRLMPSSWWRLSLEGIVGLLLCLALNHVWFVREHCNCHSNQPWDKKPWAFGRDTENPHRQGSCLGYRASPGQAAQRRVVGPPRAVVPVPLTPLPLSGAEATAEAMAFSPAPRQPCLPSYSISSSFPLPQEDLHPSLIRGQCVLSELHPIRQRINPI